jgi:hypothetical protein
MKLYNLAKSVSSHSTLPTRIEPLLDPEVGSTAWLSKTTSGVP